MEDVVLHYQPGSGAGLSALLETTEELLKPFACRTPPIFSPWSTDPRLPIRPARPAPVITSFHHSRDQSDGSLQDIRAKENPLTGLEDARASPRKRSRPAAALPPPRSWSVLAHTGVWLQASQPLSKHFCHVVSALRLHLRQRVRWVIGEHNCAAGVEQVSTPLRQEVAALPPTPADARSSSPQVWRSVSRFVQTARLPTCNATIQRERAEIWVFCDVARSEQVGLCLKDELQLVGKIRLAAHGRGSILSM